MLLSISGLYKSFVTGFRRNKKIHILTNMKLSIKQGEIYAFLGLNGVGKTTTLECIMGLQKVDLGQINFFGDNLLDNTIRKRIGYAPDKVTYFDHLSGWENVITIGSYMGINKSRREEVSHKLFTELELDYARNRLVSTYSQGMKQRLGLIISLIGDPELLIRDEPMNGLDPIGRMIVKNVMKRLQSQGKTILFSTHILSDVEEIADRFGILAQGHIVYEGITREVEGDLEHFFCNILRDKQNQDKTNIE